jgi:type IV pilus assembly protein PilW
LGAPSTPVISGGDNAEGLPARFDHPNPALSNSLTTGVVKGTDAVTVLFGQSCGAITTADMTSADPATANANNNTCNWKIAPPGTGTPLVIADCQTAQIFRASTDSSQNTRGVLATSNLKTNGTAYATGSEILLYRAYTYYIRFNPSNEPALYRFDNNANTSDEMVEGIENMQIEYGIDADDAGNDSSADQFKSNVRLDEWVLVRSVRITLTVRSVGEAADNLSNQANAPRTFNGATITDHRLLKTFAATISLRNSVK